MPQRKQDTKIHKKNTINIIAFVNSLSLWVLVAKMTFQRELSIPISQRLKGVRTTKGSPYGWIFQYSSIPVFQYSSIP